MATIQLKSPSGQVVTVDQSMAQMYSNMGYTANASTNQGAQNSIAAVQAQAAKGNASGTGSIGNVSPLAAVAQQTTNSGVASTPASGANLAALANQNSGDPVQAYLNQHLSSNSGVYNLYGGTNAGPQNTQISQFSTGGNTYYFSPGSWEAGGGGTASLSADQAKSLGGKAYTLNDGTTGYIFSNNPGGALAPGANNQNVTYNPGTGGGFGGLSPDEWTGLGLVAGAAGLGAAGGALGFGSGTAAAASDIPTGLGGIEIPAGTAASGAGSSAGGLASAAGGSDALGGLTAANAFGTPSAAVPVGTADTAGAAGSPMGFGTAASSPAQLANAASTASMPGAGATGLDVANSPMGFGSAAPSASQLSSAAASTVPGAGAASSGLSIPSGVTDALGSQAVKTGVGALTSALGGSAAPSAATTAGLATGGLGLLASSLGYGQAAPQPYNLPATDNAAMIAAQNQGQNGVMQTFHSFNDPIFNLQTTNMDTQLKNQGIFPGTTAYNNAMTQLSTQQNQLTAANEGQAAALGLTSAKNTFGMQLAGGQQAFLDATTNAGLKAANQSANVGGASNLLNSALMYGLTPQSAGAASPLSSLYQSLFGSSEPNLQQSDAFDASTLGVDPATLSGLEAGYFSPMGFGGQ